MKLLNFILLLTVIMSISVAGQNNKRRHKYKNRRRNKNNEFNTNNEGNDNSAITKLSTEDITAEGAEFLAERAHLLFKPKFSSNPVSEECKEYENIEVQKFETKQRPVKDPSKSTSVVDKVVYGLGFWESFWL